LIHLSQDGNFLGCVLGNNCDFLLDVYNNPQQYTSHIKHEIKNNKIILSTNKENIIIDRVKDVDPEFLLELGRIKFAIQTTNIEITYKNNIVKIQQKQINEDTEKLQDEQLRQKRQNETDQKLLENLKLEAENKVLAAKNAELEAELKRQQAVNSTNTNEAKKNKSESVKLENKAKNLNRVAATLTTQANEIEERLVRRLETELKQLEENEKREKKEKEKREKIDVKNISPKIPRKVDEETLYNFQGEFLNHVRDNYPFVNRISSDDTTLTMVFSGSLVFLGTFFISLIYACFRKSKRKYDRERHLAKRIEYREIKDRQRPQYSPQEMQEMLARVRRRELSREARLQNK
jgi:hypothetical protein